MRDEEVMHSRALAVPQLEGHEQGILSDRVEGGSLVRILAGDRMPLIG